MRRLSHFIFLFGAFLWAAPAHALGPEDVLVVFNAGHPHSKGVARHYAEARGVPKGNLVAVKAGQRDHIERPEFERRLLAPIGKKVASLKKNGRHPVVLLVYGVPLRIEEEGAPPGISRFKKQVTRERARVRREIVETVSALEREIGLPPGAVTPDTPARELVAHVTRRTTAARTHMATAARIPGNQDKVWTLRRLLSDLTGPGDARGLAQGRARLLFLGIPMGAEREEAEAFRKAGGLVAELAVWEALTLTDPAKDRIASVDSELAIALGGVHRINGSLPNPMLPRYDPLPGIGAIRERVVPVARLDAPTPEHARRMVDEALAAERDGLKGVFYIDARGIRPGRKKTGYGQFDERMRLLAEMVASQTDLTVVLDDTPELLGPGSAPEAALYVGWYSRANYVPAFDWVPGAVGYHVASSEAERFHKPDANNWCKRILENGAAVTLGPVAEPYLDAFPDPVGFFSMLLSGEPTLVEVYYRAIPHLSWRQVLFGDPLYRPFKAHPVWLAGASRSG